MSCTSVSLALRATCCQGAGQSVAQPGLTGGGGWVWCQENQECYALELRDTCIVTLASFHGSCHCL
jgi:hypothetical protein